MKKTTFERWREKVDMKGPDDCWEWLARKDKDGYGRILGSYKKMVGAHRYAYEHYKNNEHPVPSNLCVCHHCDNPSCVNPNHLFLGTRIDNAQDCLNKGRNFKPKPKKHTDEEVVKIRADYVSGLTQAKVAALNNTTRWTVSRIVHHKPPYER